MIGGMVAQIMIQAAILRAVLMMIAKHEADTSLAKVAMVAAGISMGTFVIGVFTVQMGPFVTIPVQIAFMAAILMTFCWISIWKSLLVVLIYATFHFLCAFLMALLLGAMFKGMMPSAQPAMPLSMPGQNMPVQIPDLDTSSAQPPVYQVPSPADAVAEANRLKEKSDAKQREVESRVKEMEKGDAPSPPVKAAEPVIVVPVSNPAPVSIMSSNPVSQKIVPEKPAMKTANGDWEAARKALRMGGRMADGDGYITMIDGKMFQKGDYVTVTFKGVRYKWKVRSISKEKVDLESVDAKPVP